VNLKFEAQMGLSINDTTEPMIIEGDADPLMPGHVRIYEMMNWYRDIPIEKYEKQMNDPLYQIVIDEIRKEIDREIIETICKNARTK